MNSKKKFITNPYGPVVLRIIIISNIKVLVKEVKTCQQKNILLKLSPTRDIIINLQKYDAWKTQLAIAIYIIYSKDWVTFFKKLNWFRNKNEKENANERERQRERVMLFSIQFNCFIANATRYQGVKKITINSKNFDDKCFQCATTIALNFEEIKKYQRKVASIKPFINNYI